MLAHASFLRVVVLSQLFVRGILRVTTAVDWFNDLKNTGYERFKPPSSATNDTSVKTNVLIEAFITHLGNFRAAQMDFEIDLELGMRWTDPRLAHADLFDMQNIPVYDSSLLGLIWRPDLYFPNAKDAKTSQVTVPNAFANIDKDGEVTFFTRVQALIACNMNFSAFPFDTQVCPIRIMSYAGAYQHFTWTWDRSLHDGKAIDISPDIQYLEFQLQNITAATCVYGDKEWGDCLYIVLTLRRNIGYHLLQTFLPTFGFVLLSWISFWLDYSLVVLKTSIALTILLTLTTLSNGIRATLPPAAYLKAVDVWMGACIAFVFATFFQIALVHFLLTQAQSAQARASELCESSTPLTPERNITENDDQKEANERKATSDLAVADAAAKTKRAITPEEQAKNDLAKAQTFKQCAHMLDDASRIVFPFGFTIFAAFFWFWYGFGNDQ